MTTAGGSNEVYSHIGMIVSKDSVGQWSVCHAVPDEAEPVGDIDRVKCEPISRFFATDRAFCGKIVRVACIDSLAQRAANETVRAWMNGTPFDHEYDKQDTTSFYCTQLIAWAYAKQGIDLLEGRSHVTSIPGFSGEYIFPSDIDESNLLTCISYY